MAKQGYGETNSNGENSRMNGHANGPFVPKALAGTAPRSLGEQLREVVGALGLTPREVAYLSGVSSDSARKAVGGAGSGPPVSDGVALRICAGLGLTLRVGPPDHATRAKLEEAHRAYVAFEAAAREIAPPRDLRGRRPR
jgi:hypothetical protein